MSQGRPHDDIMPRLESIFNEKEESLMSDRDNREASRLEFLVDAVVFRNKSEFREELRQIWRRQAGKIQRGEDIFSGPGGFPATQSSMRSFYYDTAEKTLIGPVTLTIALMRKALIDAVIWSQLKIADAGANSALLDRMAVIPPADQRRVMDVRAILHCTVEKALDLIAPCDGSRVDDMDGEL